MTYEDALIFAAAKHKGQIRKDGTPYIVHPVRVSLYLQKHGYPISYQIAGLFHDLLEDTDASEEEIAAYGEDVLEAVKLLSKNLEPDLKVYHERILAHTMAKIIKNADRIDNLRDAKNSGDLRFMRKYYEESLEVYKGRFSAELDKEVELLKEYIEANN